MASSETSPATTAAAADAPLPQWQTLLELAATSQEDIESTTSSSCGRKSETEEVLLTSTLTYPSTMQSSENEDGIPSMTLSGSDTDGVQQQQQRARMKSTDDEQVEQKVLAMNKSDDDEPSQKIARHLSSDDDHPLSSEPAPSLANIKSLESFHFVPQPRPQSTFIGFHADQDLQRQLQEEQKAMEKLERLSSYHIRENVHVETVDSDVDLAAARQRQEYEQVLAQQRQRRRQETAGHVLQSVLVGLSILVLIAVGLSTMAITQYGLIAAVSLCIIVGFVLGLAYFVRYHVLAMSTPLDDVNPTLRPIHKTIRRCINATKTFLQDEAEAFQSEWKEYMLLLEDGDAMDEPVAVVVDSEEPPPCPYENMDEDATNDEPQQQEPPKKHKSIGFRVLKPFLRARRRIRHRRAGSKKDKTMELSTSYRPPNSESTTIPEGSAADDGVFV